MKHQLYLSLGSNLGNRRFLLDEAVRLLGERVGVVVAVSSFIETEPWGFESEHSFLNVAVHLETEMEPLDVLVRTQQIERELGRTRKSDDGTYHDRPIDIDILLYDDVRLDGEFTVSECVDGVPTDRRVHLTIPHPLMHERDFVMIPLREILPEG